MQTLQGSLVFLGMNTTCAAVLWNGAVVPFVTDIRADWEKDEQRIKLKVSDNDVLHDELRAAGITVKLEVRHE